MIPYYKIIFHTNDGYKLIKYKHKIEGFNIFRFVVNTEKIEKAKYISFSIKNKLIKPNDKKYRIFKRGGQIIFIDKGKNYMDIKKYLTTLFTLNVFHKNCVYNLKVNATLLTVSINEINNNNNISPNLTKLEMLKKIQELDLHNIRFCNYKIHPDDIEKLFIEFQKVFE